MRVYIQQQIAETGLRFLEEKGYEYVVANALTEERIVRDVTEYHPDAIIVRTGRISEAVIRAAGPQLKVIARHGAGTDNIDVDYAHAHGIIVCNGPYSNTDAVAQHVLLFVLECAGRSRMLDQAVRSGDWKARDRVRLVQLNGQVTVGFIGLGRIGSAAAAKIHGAFPDVKILAWSRNLKDRTVPDYVAVAEEMLEVFRKSDFVSLNCPLTAENHGMVSAKVLHEMKPGAYLINCARGGLIDEKALYEAIKNHVIAGAALDVLAQEPVTENNPLLELDNVIFSPHCAAHTDAAFEKMAMDAVIGADRVLSGGKPQWPV